jgi:hypothetical protein
VTDQFSQFFLGCIIFGFGFHCKRIVAIHEWRRFSFKPKVSGAKQDWGTGIMPTQSPTCSGPEGNLRQRAASASRMTFIISAFVVLSACEQNTFVPPPPPKVDVSAPAQRAITRYLEATGNTAAIKSVDLVARVQGFLQSIDYQDGTFVKAGTTLFTIEPETYKLKLEQAQAAEAGAQASLKQAEADF